MEIRQIRLYDKDGISVLRESMDGPDGYDVITLDDSEFSEGVAIPTSLIPEIIAAILGAIKP